MSAETIPALLAARGAASPELEAIVGDDGRLSYADLNRRSESRAAWLVASGVNKNHRVGLLMTNGVEWAVNAYAIMRIGAILTPLSTLLRPIELTSQLEISGVHHLIASPTHRGRDYHAEISGIDRGALPSLRNIWWSDEVGGNNDPVIRAVAAKLESLVKPGNDMAIIFTSGSSGTPKGVIHTHGGAIRANAAGLSARCVRTGTRLYLPMPLFWVGGFSGGLISALNAGATLLTEAAPEPAKTLRFIAGEKATLFRGWPDQAAHIAGHPDYPMADLSALQPGSLDALLPLQARAKSGLRANLFGMTESFGPYCGYPLDQELPADKQGSCGLPFEGIELRIVDTESGTPLPSGQIGSIQLRSRNLFRSICRREREELFTPDGWYDGGDLGRLDAEGFLYFAGRCDDMFKIKGASVYPSEVESALHQIDGVKRAVATDIVVDGKVTIGAAVVLTTHGSLSAAQLHEEARQRLSSFKVPTCWRLLTSIDELPRTVNGKIDKRELRKMLLSV